ncbi:MAG: PP2C family protein-serine/threonine phosphatase [Massilia sp.]
MHPWKPPAPPVPKPLGLGLALGLTDTGTVRSTNEDNFLVERELGLVAVADGMGGHECGEVASAGALGALLHYLRAAACPDGDDTVPNFQASAFDPAQTDPEATWTDDTMRAMIALHDAVEYANLQLYQANLARGRGDGSGMGTTLTGMWQPAPGGPVFVFHVGDTRLYRFRDGHLSQVTRDQTMYQQALDAGFASNLPPRNLLLQALGPGPDIRPELLTQALAPGDLYLLCSDGLHGACPDQRIAQVLARCADDLTAGCAELVEMAKRDGSRDNITVVLARCEA